MGLLVDTPEEIMLKALTSNIREALRARIMAAIEPDIKDAIDQAMAKFNVQLASYVEHTGMERMVKVLLEDRRS